MAGPSAPCAPSSWCSPGRSALYARFVLEQSLESFLRCHTLAFQALGGVPRSLLYDNLKSVVLERVGDHIRFHPKLLEFAGHYHFAPKPCAPYRGNEKGKVERSIHYLRHSFFAARTYSSLDDLNSQLSRWIEDTAHARCLPGDTSRRVHQALEEESPRLLALPENAFGCDVVRTLHSGKRGNRWSLPVGHWRPSPRMVPVPSWWASRGSARSSAAPAPSNYGKHRGRAPSPSGTSPSPRGKRRGPEHGQREPCRAARGGAPAILRHAVLRSSEQFERGVPCLRI
ncbi:transposase [Archangium violaceum]|nr:transposase [Archangium violaceum]